MSQQNKQKHVMLSYEWKRQKLVLSIYDYLIDKQISTWMDIKAGISSNNLYEGIAEAVENSTCLVCFMTPEYQMSDFCKQEFQYAKQCNIPIIPLKLEENWNPSSWLGFITAGLLWLDFYHIKNFERKAAQLYSRICKTIGNESPLQNSNESKPVEQEKVLPFRPVFIPRAFPLSGQVKTDKETPTLQSNVTNNRRTSPLSKLMFNAYMTSPRTISDISDVEEKDDAKMYH